jgi:hypothetical protein
MYGIARNPALMGAHTASRSAAAGYLIAIAFIAGCVGSLAVLSLR